MTVVYLHDWLLLFGFIFGLRACVEEDNLSNVWCEGKRYTNPKAKGGVYIVSCYATFGYVSNDICFHVFFTVKFFPHRVVLTGRVKTFVLRIQPLLISPMYEFSEMCMVPFHATACAAFHTKKWRLTFIHPIQTLLHRDHIYDVRTKSSRIWPPVASHRRGVEGTRCHHSIFVGGVTPQWI